MCCTFGKVYSMELLQQLFESPEVQKIAKEVAAATVVYVTTKIGWKEFKKGTLLPGQKKKEKSSEKVRKKLHKEVLELQKEVMVNRKVLLYLLSVCDEADIKDFQSLLSEEEKLVINQLL